jgi:hypothetical protein
MPAGHVVAVDVSADEKYFTTVQADANDHLRTHRLPQFRLHIPTLWRPALPNTDAIRQAVQQMLADA